MARLAVKEQEDEDDIHKDKPTACMAPSPMLLPLLVLTTAAFFAPRPNSAMDPVGTYYAKNFKGAQTQASISTVLAVLVHVLGSLGRCPSSGQREPSSTGLGGAPGTSPPTTAGSAWRRPWPSSPTTAAYGGAVACSTCNTLKFAFL